MYFTTKIIILTWVVVMGKYDKSMMGTAELFAKQSYCKKGQVGAVLERDGRILATGYNGTIAGQKNECEDIFYVCPNCKKSETELENLVETNSIQSAEHRGMQFSAYCKKCHELLGSSVLFVISRARNQEPTIIKSFEPTYKTSEFTVHAEQNIITYCAKNGIPTDGTTMYTTMSPCKQCAKLIAQAGIIKVVYKDDYKDISGIEFLEKVNIKISKYKVKQD